MSSNLAEDHSGRVTQVFSPDAIIAVSNGALTVSSYSVIMFNAVATLQLNGAGETFDWPADIPLGIGSGVKTVTISGLGAATTALVM
jgi:hypothetical protein